MAAQAHIYTYTDGIVHGYVEEIEPPADALIIQGDIINAVALGLSDPRDGDFYRQRYNKVVLQATTNGKAWSYAIRPYLKASGGVGEGLTYIPAYTYTRGDQFTRQAYRSRTTLPHPYRDLVAWALKDMVRRAKLPQVDPNALRPNVAYECEAPQESSFTKPGPAGPIRYTGYPAKIGAYDREAIHAIVADAVAVGMQAWAWRTVGTPQWRPSNLEVMLHEGRRALGLAFAPGTGRDRNQRTISLNAVLFKLYDRQSIWRVVIHELCHHYRDEVFPAHERDAAVADAMRQAVLAHQMADRTKTLSAQVFNTHDSVFVRELARVDPKVAADHYTGLVFTEYADASLVADAKAVKEARLAKKLAKVDWAPEAGYLIVGRTKSNGAFPVLWAAKDGSWKSPPARIDRTGEALGGLLRKVYEAGGRDQARFEAAQVTYTDTWPLHWSKPPTLGQFTTYAENQFNQHLWSRITV